MNSEAEWQSIRGDRGTFLGIAGVGILRATLLFGSAAVALALVLAPIVDNQTRQFSATPAGLDRMSTGSITRPGTGGGYTIRRSVLQDSPSAICIIRDNGRRSGNCG
jgi:hypothetical protein